MLRKLLVAGVVTPFVCLAVYDLWHGRRKTGTTSALFAMANTLIFW